MERVLSTLLNTVNEAEELETIEMIQGPIKKIGRNEVEWAIKRMNTTKSVDHQKYALQCSKNWEN